MNPYNLGGGQPRSSTTTDAFFTGLSNHSIRSLTPQQHRKQHLERTNSNESLDPDLLTIGNSSSSSINTRSFHRGTTVTNTNVNASRSCLLLQSSFMDPRTHDYADNELQFEQGLPQEPEGVPITRQSLAASKRVKLQTTATTVASKRSSSTASTTTSIPEAATTTAPRLDRSSKTLFGRDEELNLLSCSLEATREATTIARVHGASGCGKTTLCGEFAKRLHQEHQDKEEEIGSLEELYDSDSSIQVAPPTRQEQHERRQPIFISGKFDPFQRHVPYAAIVAAFDTLGNLLCDVQEQLMGPISSCAVKPATARRPSKFLAALTNAKPFIQEFTSASTVPTVSSSSFKQQMQMSLHELDCVLELFLYEGKVLTQLVSSFQRFVDQSCQPRENHASQSSWGVHLNNSSSSHSLNNSQRSFSLAPNTTSPVGASLTAGANNNNEGSCCLTERLLLAFTSLLKTICAPQRPLVWFLDDLQWADASSLRLLSTIIADDDLCNLQVLIGYRDMLPAAVWSDTSAPLSLGQIVMTPELQSFFEGLPQNKNRSVDIELHNLNLPVISEWMATILKAHTSDNPAFELFAQVVHLKTGGNPYFVLQYLELLQRKKLLTYSFSSLKWEWNMNEIMNIATKKRVQEKNQSLREDEGKPWLVSETIHEVVTMQIASMPATVQRLMQVAACLGFFFDAPLLESLSEHCDSLLLLGFSVANKSIYDDEILEVEDNPQDEEFDEDGGVSVYRLALTQAEAEGLIERTGDERVYKFTHDQIQKTVSLCKAFVVASDCCVIGAC
jgi:predicted ATPase